MEVDLRDARHTQLYLPETNVLLTRFLADCGVAEVSDFMPIEAETGSLRIGAPNSHGTRFGAFPDSLCAALRLWAGDP